jgi:hypothetical protein
MALFVIDVSQDAPVFAILHIESLQYYMRMITAVSALPTASCFLNAQQLLIDCMYPNFRPRFVPPQSHSIHY